MTAPKTTHKYAIVRPTGRGQRHLITSTIVGSGDTYRVLAMADNSHDAEMVRKALVAYQQDPAERVKEAEGALAARLPRAKK